MAEQEHDVERISYEIQRYLNNHPNACDTLEGITRWWLTRQRYEEGKDKVQKALYLLVHRKRLREIKVFDGKHIYKKA